MTSQPAGVSVVGGGAMGMVCALLLDAKGVSVTVWGAFADHVARMLRSRMCRQLPGCHIPESIRLTADDRTALADAQLIVSAIPTQHMRSVWQRLGPHTPGGVPIVSVAKGVEARTLLRPTQIVADVVGASKLAALSGPSVAAELLRCLPATVCAASDDSDTALAVQRAFTTRWFRVYTNDDLLGVELAGATKNVIALAAGILDGLEAGNNAKSALLSRGLAEIGRLGLAMGAGGETFFGLAGVGDLATTCFSPTGRNRTCGELLGRGRRLQDVLAEVPGVVEGVPTTRAVVDLASRHGVEMPITTAVHRVLFEDGDPVDQILRLMSRQPKAEGR